MFLNFDRHTAARFSFLLSTPAIAAAGAKAIWDLRLAGGVPDDLRVPVAVGIVVSALTGAAAIGFFLRFIRRASLRLFIWYRIVFGIIVLALAVFLR
jgi:undecaprenyl-diphosphatase